MNRYFCHGQVYRYPRSKDPVPPELDGLPNYWHVTHVAGQKRALLDRGLSSIAPVAEDDWSRVPAILVRTSHHRSGTADTPWHDRYEIEEGRVVYFGDAKPVHMPNPETAPGNKALLAGSTLYESISPAERMAAPPLLFFQAWSKGRVEFVGLGLTETVERVAQRMPGGEFFSNYRYECALLSLSEEGERLAWNWIADRGRTEVDNEGSLKHAPASWKNWVYGASLDSQRRKMAVSPSLSSKEQLPPPGSKQDRLLKQVISFYKGRQHRFEAVAEVIASQVLGKRYEMGWVTRGTGDRGIDFVGRLTIGDGAASTKVVVLGQAKCEAPGKPTNGMDVSRTVARLQRGWIGCYVTTSFFSRQSQEELAVDKYPLITISGDRVVKELEQIAAESGVTVMELVRSIDDGYKERLKHRRPEEVLYI